MSDWTSDPTWADVPELTLEQIQRKAGARLVHDQETFEAIVDLHAAMAAKGHSDQDIAEAVGVLLDAQRRARH